MPVTKKAKKKESNMEPSLSERVTDAADELSEYEKIRLEHIKRNHEFMQQLGLFTVMEQLAEDSAATTTKKQQQQPARVRVKAPPLPDELCRRSLRVKKEIPQYTNETIDRFGEQMDAKAARVILGKKRGCDTSGYDESSAEGRGEYDDDIDYEAMKDEMREAAMQHMIQVRQAILPTAIEDESSAAPDEWREEAVRRWGSAAGASLQQHQHQIVVVEKGDRSSGSSKSSSSSSSSSSSGNRDWKAYVQSRLSKPPPVSPIDFLQEYYAADVWRLLVACILMSRVSSLDTKHRCISAFFSLYPTPTAFLHEDDWNRVRSAINSLGLFDDRLKSLIALTTYFLECDEFVVSPDPKSPHKIRGVGAFGYESYLVFCKDEGATIKLSDGGKPLAPFVAWRKKLASSSSSSPPPS